MGGSEATLGNAIATAMIFAFFASPILGSISDRYDLKMPLRKPTRQVTWERIFAGRE